MMHVSRQRSGTLTGNPADHSTGTEMLKEGIRVFDIQL